MDAGGKKKLTKRIMSDCWPKLPLKKWYLDDKKKPRKMEMRDDKTVSETIKKKK